MICWNPAVFPLSLCRQKTADIRSVQLSFQCTNDTLQLDTTSVPIVKECMTAPSVQNEPSSSITRQSNIEEARAHSSKSELLVGNEDWSCRCDNKMLPACPELYSDNVYFLNTDDIYM